MKVSRCDEYWVYCTIVHWYAALIYSMHHERIYSRWPGFSLFGLALLFWILVHDVSVSPSVSFHTIAFFDTCRGVWIGIWNTLGPGLMRARGSFASSTEYHEKSSGVLPYFNVNAVNFWSPRMQGVVYTLRWPECRNALVRKFTRWWVGRYLVLLP